MIARPLTALACLSFLTAMPAAAQTTTGSMPDNPAAAAAPAAKKARSKTPQPAQVVTLTNATRQTATEVIITGEEEKTAKLSKPLAPKAKASLKLPKLKECLVQVAATFEGEGQVDIGEFDICKDKTIRFTE